MTDSSPPEPPSDPPVPPTPPSQPPPGFQPPPPGGPFPTTGGAGRGDYPVTFDVDYPDRDLNKLTTFFRLAVAIPIFIVLISIGGQYAASSNSAALIGTVGLLFLPVLLMIVFREKYPRWWFDFNLEFLRFSSRVGAYVMLLSDVYPSTDEEQYVHLEVQYPDVKTELNRFMPLIKWLLVIPHWIVLFFLSIGATFATIYAWFAILFTGRYPRDVFDLVVGVNRWFVRIYAYAFLLTTDEYPPFKLSE